MRLEALLTASAERSPGAIAALESDGRAICYGDLEEYARSVEAALAALGVKAGDRVGLCTPKNISALASVFAILRAGAAYVPADVSAPAERNAYIFNDCSVRALIVDAGCADALQAQLGGIWTRHAFPAAGAHYADFLILAPEAARSPGPENARDLAYILYTSGSTGRPKGVMHSHATALAFVDWCSEEFDPKPEDRFSSHAPFHFDLSILDIYVPIKHGASVVLIASEPGKQPGTLADVIARRGVTVWYSTPSILRMLVEYGKLEERDCSALRLVFFAGEVFPIKHLRALMALWPHPAYYNLYGPTETNVCTYYKVPASIPEEQSAALPIGRKCSGDDTLVVTETGQAAPHGEEGELLVAGGSVMLGYWNLPEQNARAFREVGGRAWYGTGDVVREDEAGDFIFLGRRDRMVKRRGFRVELGEIEAALHRHAAIPEAAVIATANSEGEVQVHAFLTSSAEVPPSTIKLKQFCAENLPIYMVPDRFTVLPELPKTSTDKIDYQRLKGLA